MTASARPPPSPGDDWSANICAGRKSASSRSRLASPNWPRRCGSLSRLLRSLIELHLHLLGDRHQLLVDAIANRVEALRGLLIQALKLDLELLRSEQQRTG